MDEHGAGEALNELTPAAIRTLAEVHDTFLQFLSSTLAKNNGVHRVRGMRNIGSFSTIS